MTDLAVKLGKIGLDTPLVGASGLFGYGLEYGNLIDWRAYGAVVAKTITLDPRAGNKPSRVADVGCGVLNSIGLENVGCDAFVREKLPHVKLPCKLFVSIGGETVDEYREVARRLAGQRAVGPGIAAIEVNVSCPNVARGCAAFGRDPDAVREVVRAVRAETDLPVIPKLPPLLAGLEEVARAACDGGADALVVANTYPGMAIDIENEKPRLGNLTGGLSGPAIRPLSLLLVWQVVEAVDVPVIGGGGVEQAEDAIEYLLAGAAAVEIGSIVLRDLGRASAILAGVAAYMEKKGYATIDDFRGKARR